MKKMLLSAYALCLIVSCQKEELTPTENPTKQTIEIVPRSYISYIKSKTRINSVF